MYIVIVYANGHARRYDAATGADKGSVGTSQAAGCNISAGTIMLQYANGTSRRYDARTGADRGSV